jgi:hypothetical protein
MLRYKIVINFLKIELEALTKKDLLSSRSSKLSENYFFETWCLEIFDKLNVKY